MDKYAAIAKQLCTRYLVGALTVEHGDMDLAVEAAHRMFALASKYEVSPASFHTTEDGTITVLIRDHAYCFSVDDLDDGIKAEIAEIKRVVASGEHSASTQCPACNPRSRVLN